MAQTKKFKRFGVIRKSNYLALTLIKKVFLVDLAVTLYLSVPRNEEIIWKKMP